MIEAARLSGGFGNVSPECKKKILRLLVISQSEMFFYNIKTTEKGKVF